MLRQFVLLKQQDQVPNHLTVRQMMTCDEVKLTVYLHHTLIEN